MLALALRDIGLKHAADNTSLFFTLVPGLAVLYLSLSSRHHQPQKHVLPQLALGLC